MIKKIPKIFDVVLIVLMIFCIVMVAMPYIKPLYINSLSSSEKKLVNDKQLIVDLESMAAIYYGKIITTDLDTVNKICEYNNQKTEADITRLKEELSSIKDVKVKAYKTYKLAKDTYRCEIIIKNTTDMVDTDNKHTIVIRVIEKSNLFKVLADN